nr:uncharacterized protein LOC109163575 isoform X2 [Ipomoea trifida]
MRWTSTLLPHLCLWSLSTNGWITSSLSTNGRQHQQQGNSGSWTVKQGTAAELGGEATAPGLAESCFRRAPPPSAWTWQRRIDDVVESILRVKFITGVFDHPFTDKFLLDVVGCKWCEAGETSPSPTQQEPPTASRSINSSLAFPVLAGVKATGPVNSGHLLGLAWQLGVAVPSSARSSDGESPPVVRSLCPVSGENGTSANIFFDTLMVEKVRMYAW